MINIVKKADYLVPEFSRKVVSKRLLQEELQGYNPVAPETSFMVHLVLSSQKPKTTIEKVKTSIVNAVATNNYGTLHSKLFIGMYIL